MSRVDCLITSATDGYPTKQKCYDATTCTGTACEGTGWNWTKVKIGDCSAQCGDTGKQTYTFECQNSTNVKVSDTCCTDPKPINVVVNCDPSPTCNDVAKCKPPNTCICTDMGQCNLSGDACEPEATYNWARMGVGNSCTVECGDTGTQPYDVWCTPNYATRSPEKCCKGTKPSETGVCDPIPACEQGFDCKASTCVNSKCSADTKYSWVTGDWSSCSLTCGGGSQKRDVVCAADGIVRAADNSCCYKDTDPPANTRSCIDTTPCVCDPVCANGEICIDTNKCVKVPGPQDKLCYGDPSCSNVCLHGGDTMSCTAHGVCGGDGTDYGGSWKQVVDPTTGKWTSNSCAQDELGPRFKSDVCKSYGWFADSSARCQCEDGWHGTACQIPKGDNGNSFGFPGPDKITHYAMNSVTGEITAEDSGTATTTDYSNLAYAGGMCGQSNGYSVANYLPYIIGDDGKVTDKTVDGALAVNPLMFGERVHRPNKDWANPDPTEDTMAAGKSCGGCWKLNKNNSDGSTSSITGVVVDRCGGNCLLYPTIQAGDTCTPACAPSELCLSGKCAANTDKLPRNFRDYEGMGADWRGLLKDDANKPFVQYLVNADCSNMMYGKGAQGGQSGWVASRAPSAVDADPTAQMERKKLADWYGLSDGKPHDVVDWCSASAHPHFDIDPVAHAKLCAKSGVGNCVADSWEPVACTPMGYKNLTEISPTASPDVWPAGCDRTSWTNCGMEEVIPNWNPDSQIDGGGGWGLKQAQWPVVGRCCQTQEGVYATESACTEACKSVFPDPTTIPCDQLGWGPPSCEAPDPEECKKAPSCKACLDYRLPDSLKCETTITQEACDAYGQGYIWCGAA